MSGGKKTDIKVILLDDTVQNFKVPIKAIGHTLFEDVVTALNLTESNYFDMEYTDINGVQCWLDPEKAIMKQVNTSNDLTFRFSVKFYTPDPGVLEEEYTRYLFALQIKRDLATGILPVTDNTAALLAAYIAQSEFGDFNEEDCQDHTYLQSFNFVPNQTDELEQKIMEYHKTMIGQSPAEADFNLLDTARKVELYGHRMHHAKHHEGGAVSLTVASTGIFVYQNATKINTFSWAKIRKLSFKRRLFLVKLHPEGYGYYKDLVEFYFDSRNECKNFWKKCIEHHAFFRCLAPKTVPRNKTRVLSRGSSFRYSGRTQKQLVDYVREHGTKMRPFERKSQSMRSSRSASNNKSSTLNSREAQLSMLSASAGYSSPLTSTHLERADVHDETTNGKKLSLSNPDVTDSPGPLKEPVSDLDLDRDQNNMPNDSNKVESQSNDICVDSQKPANQNANDNDETITHGSYHLEKGVIEVGSGSVSSPTVDSPKEDEKVAFDTVLHIDEAKLSGKGDDSFDNNKEYGKLSSEEIDLDSDSNDDDGEKTSAIGDVPYVLHRRHVDMGNGEIAEVTVGRAKMTDARPEVQFTTFRTNESSNTTGANSVAPKSPILADRMKASLSSDSSSECASKPIEIVTVNKLPSKNSYSSADDSTSPSLEQEIFKLISSKNNETHLLDTSDVFENEKEPIEEQKVFSTFCPPEVTIQGPTPIPSPSEEGTANDLVHGKSDTEHEDVFRGSSGSSTSSESRTSSESSSDVESVGKVEGSALEELKKLESLEAAAPLVSAEDDDDEDDHCVPAPELPPKADYKETNFPVLAQIPPDIHITQPTPIPSRIITHVIDEESTNSVEETDANFPPPPSNEGPEKHVSVSSDSDTSSSDEDEEFPPPPPSPSVEEVSPGNNVLNVIQNPFTKPEPDLVCNEGPHDPHHQPPKQVADQARNDYEMLNGSNISPTSPELSFIEKESSPDQLDDLEDLSGDSTSDTTDDEIIKPKVVKDEPSDSSSDGDDENEDDNEPLPPIPARRPITVSTTPSNIPPSPGMSRHVVGLEMSPDRKVITTVHKEIQNGQVIENRHTEVLDERDGVFYTNPYADMDGD